MYINDLHFFPQFVSNDVSSMAVIELLKFLIGWIIKIIILSLKDISI